MLIVRAKRLISIIFSLSSCVSPPRVTEPLNLLFSSAGEAGPHHGPQDQDQRRQTQLGQGTCDVSSLTTPQFLVIFILPPFTHFYHSFIPHLPSFLLHSLSHPPFLPDLYLILTSHLSSTRPFSPVTHVPHSWSSSPAGVQAAVQSTEGEDYGVLLRTTSLGTNPSI